MVFLSTSLLCLAMTVYHEARGETIEAQRAVAYVALNRALTEEKEVCQVIKEKHQFTWVQPGGKAKKAKEIDAWFQSVNVAYNVYNGIVKDPTKGANHFIKVGTEAAWVKDCRRSRVIDKQLFCFIQRRDTKHMKPPVKVSHSTMVLLPEEKRIN